MPELPEVEIVRQSLHKKIKKNIKIKDATNHPNWQMGKKISVDSATLMNKVFEIIEAKKIFDIDLDKFEILIHPKSYIHAIVKLKNGLITDREYEKLQNEFENSFVNTNSSISGIANSLASYYYLFFLYHLDS